MEIRYLNKESLKELSFYVKTRDYYKEKLEKLREIKNEVTDQVSSITINISYKTKESYNSLQSLKKWKISCFFALPVLNPIYGIGSVIPMMKR